MNSYLRDIWLVIYGVHNQVGNRVCITLVTLLLFLVCTRVVIIVVLIVCGKLNLVSLVKPGNAYH